MTKLFKAGTITKPVILNKIMSGITEKYMKYHLDDIFMDFHCLLNEDDTNNFIWIVRELGTWILKEKEIYIKDSNADLIINHCIENNQIKKIYKITVTKRSKRNNIYGTIMELDKKLFLQNVVESPLL